MIINTFICEVVNMVIEIMLESALVCVNKSSDFDSFALFQIHYYIYMFMNFSSINMHSYQAKGVILIFITKC